MISTELIEIIDNCNFLLDFQKQALSTIIDDIKKEEYEETINEDISDYDIIDHILLRLLGKGIDNLSVTEQREITYAIQDFR